jgi:hypothetical protein
MSKILITSHQAPQLSQSNAYLHEKTTAPTLTTSDVVIDGTTHRVRYIGVNTPERNEDCFSEASEANSLMVMGKTVRLVKDKSEK